MDISRKLANTKSTRNQPKRNWSRPSLEGFAGKLSQASRHCRLKGKKFTSGKKTSQPVLKVITCYSHASISPVSSRERLRSDKASHGDAARMVVDSQTEDEDDDSGSDTDDDDILLKPCLAQE